MKTVQVHLIIWMTLDVFERVPWLNKFNLNLSMSTKLPFDPTIILLRCFKNPTENMKNPFGILFCFNVDPT